MSNSENENKKNKTPQIILLIAAVVTIMGYTGKDLVQYCTRNFTDPIPPKIKLLSSTYDEGVIINGVKWATRNVDAPGTFAASPEDAGMFYQWNRKKAWPTAGSITGWDSSNPIGTVWEKDNDPSPVGWRVPTLDEFEKLLNTDSVSNVWTKENNIYGRKFTDKTKATGGNSIFLPAAGFRDHNDGVESLSYCHYWSSMQYGSNDAYRLFFDNSGVDRKYGYGYRSYGFSVRPVVAER